MSSHKEGVNYQQIYKLLPYHLEKFHHKFECHSKNARCFIRPLCYFYYFIILRILHKGNRQHTTVLRVGDGGGADDDACVISAIIFE